MQMLRVLGLVFISDRWLCIAITYVFNPESSLSRLIDVAELHLELALPAHFVGRITWSTRRSTCQLLLKRALRVLCLHQRGASWVCNCMYFCKMQILPCIASTGLPSLLRSHSLFRFDELFCVVYRSHDVVVPGLLHHMLPTTSKHRPSVPPWRVTMCILRACMRLISLVVYEAALIDIFPAWALPIDWWSSLSLVWVLIAIRVSGASHCVRKFWLPLEREFEAS